MKERRKLHSISLVCNCNLHATKKIFVVFGVFGNWTGAIFT